MVLVLSAGLPAAGGLAQQGGPALDPGLEDTLCMACHRDRFEALAASPHAVLDTPEWRERTGVMLACVNCHGDADEHIRNGGGEGNVFAFHDESAADKNAVCLDCHSSTHPDFDSSPHARAGLACSDCHTQHGATTAGTPLLKTFRSVAAELDDLSPISQLCADCHQDKLTAFAFNEHHRLIEGALECTSCHDPHAAATRTLLGGFKQQMCIDCHTDKGGPFVFEHPASRIESCTVCHTPHGSPNRHLLAYQNVGELCLSCHAEIPQFHLGFSPAGPPRFDTDTQCTNCHSAIHGSNFSDRFLR